MGKYIRKTKVSGEVAVVDVAHQSSLGVRTRAFALAAALQSQSPAQDPSFAYLELRSRRLEKPAPTTAPATAGRMSRGAIRDGNPNPKGAVVKGRGGSRANSGSARACSNEGDESMNDVEVSFGENFPDTMERYVRETTPCSLIRDSETITTPGSTTRRTSLSATSRRMPNPMHCNIPSAHEMENFFAGAEQIQQQIFMERYNFDPVNDHPLPGRYEWVQLDF